VVLFICFYYSSFVYNMKIPVAIVEDNNDIRFALEQIIEMSEYCELAGSCVSGEEALVKIPLLNPKVVLMDIGLGGISGIEVVRELKTSHPEILFMMCTIYEDDEKIFEALSAGASGYILKKTPPVKLLEGIQELMEGGSPMSSQIARKVVAAFQNKKTGNFSNESALDILSKREKEILEMLSKGLLYKEISDAVFISTETVRKHVYHIYEKLHVTNRVEAVNKYFGR
jgi:DNA-binding NarL/FixJ family response regulator